LSPWSLINNNNLRKRTLVIVTNLSHNVTTAAFWALYTLEQFQFKPQ
jgi:hypothetical protein